DLMATVRVAVWLGVSPEWLEIGRSKGWGPPFLRLSPRRVRYRRGDVKKWLQERAYRSTSQYETQPGPGRGHKGAAEAAGRATASAPAGRARAGCLYASQAISTTVATGATRGKQNRAGTCAGRDGTRRL